MDGTLQPEAAGYASAAYAWALTHLGAPLLLPRSRGWLMQRAIPGTNLTDATGPYPLFSCANWASLGDDLENLEKRLVSAVTVIDPFGDHSSESLKRWFPDLMRPFKDHFVVDLSQDPNRFVAENHRRNTRKALKDVSVVRCEPPIQWADQWTKLYRFLISRHQVRGAAAFSSQSLTAQLCVPGMVLWRADADGETVGMALWVVQGEVGYYHLAAYSEAGYQRRVSFALFWHVLDYFADCGLRWLNLGAGAGLQAREDGLTRFKRGWSTGTRTAYLCGRILDRIAYERLMSAGSTGLAPYFPAYHLRQFS